MHPPIIQLRTSIYSNPAERMPETLHTAHISALRACTSTITLIITLSYSGRLLWICIGPVIVYSFIEVKILVVVEQDFTDDVLQ